MSESQLPLARDAVTPLAAFATATERIKLATGVVNNWTRSAGLMAMTLAAPDELSQARAAGPSQEIRDRQARCPN